MKKRFVVVGASAASIAFITKLRTIDSSSEVICISGESDIPYNRCLLADYISQETSLQEMELKSQDFFKEQSIDLRLKTWVKKIDTKQNKVFIQDESIEYDYLFLGTGTRPHMPDVGVSASDPGIFTFHTADDVRRLSDFIEKEKPINTLVVGAGLNGIECASALHDRGVAVSLIERASHVLPLQVDNELAEYVQSILQHKGIGLFLNHAVVQICKNNNVVQSVKLDSGAAIATDCIVFATGSLVNAELLEGTGIKTRNGSIIVDNTMKTSIDNVYAGGDICILQDVVTKELVQSTTWPDAMLQGLCAATRFSDKQRSYPGFVGLRDSKFFGYPFYACGKTVHHESDVEEILHPGMDSFIKLYLQNNRLKGFVLIGDISKVAEYKRLYLTQQEVSKSDLL